MRVPSHKTHDFEITIGKIQENNTKEILLKMWTIDLYIKLIRALYQPQKFPIVGITNIFDSDAIFGLENDILYRSGKIK